MKKDEQIPRKNPENTFDSIKNPGHPSSFDDDVKLETTCDAIDNAPKEPELWVCEVTECGASLCKVQWRIIVIIINIVDERGETEVIQNSEHGSEYLLSYLSQRRSES